MSDNEKDDGIEQRDSETLKESTDDLIDDLEELKSLGELKINSDSTDNDQCENDDKDDKDDTESQSINSESNLETSHRSSLPSLSGILSSFSGRGKNTYIDISFI